MKYHTALVKHDPPNSYGDCLRASVACILDRDHVEHVPHFFYDGCDAETGVKRLRDWCASIGFIPYFQAFDGSLLIDDLLKGMKRINPNVNYLLFGCTESGEEHVVICRNDIVIHNVAWYGSHIVKPTTDDNWLIVVFVPKILGDV